MISQLKVTKCAVFTVVAFLGCFALSAGSVSAHDWDDEYYDSRPYSGYYPPNVRRGGYFEPVPPRWRGGDYIYEEPPVVIESYPRPYPNDYSDGYVERYARPRSCGEYYYWDGRFCVDAREYPPYVGPK